MEQAQAICADGKAGTVRSDLLVAVRDRGAQESRLVMPIALRAGAVDTSRGGFYLDDTIIPVRWKI